MWMKRHIEIILFHAGSTSTFSSGSGYSIRLVDGPSAREGRVELWRSGEWGTVCDDSWGLNDAHVACSSLGYSGASQAPCCARYGQGTGSIILDNLGCSGSESTLYACSHSGTYVHNCGHSEDASAVCEYSIHFIIILLIKIIIINL